MTGEDLIRQWADRYGLATAPLFGNGESGSVVAGSHGVLLDGGHGSFALSVSEEELWRAARPADWAWSSNLPHHVTVTENTVAVTRWDRPSTEILSRTSVEERSEQFYSYLAKDRVRSTSIVVDYVLNLFRRLRSLVSVASVADERSVDAFLAFLALLIDGSEDATKSVETYRLETGREVLKSLPRDTFRSLFRFATERTPSGSLQFLPALAVRHAGAEIFQEAHFELLRPTDVDLFGLPGMPELKPLRRGGVHFTPAPLARAVVERAFAQIEDLTKRSSIRVLDPACGSGAFLHEVVRYLRRNDFKGTVTLMGRDVSAAAVAMADFVVRHAVLDWSRRPVEVDIEVADSLEVTLPRADVILMNPPFLAWSALSADQRDQFRAILGDRTQGRGDLSMAFVSRAMDVLEAGGVLGVLMPSSLLTLQAAGQWRTDLLERAELRMLASLGDYGLFAHAMVQVAAAVFVKGNPTAEQGVVVGLLTEDSADATGNALRALRRMGGEYSYAGAEGAWQLFGVRAAEFVRRPTWRLIPPKVETAMARLLDAGALRLGDVFEVRQGVRTGYNKSFVLDRSEYLSLPLKEKHFFRPAVMNDSIQDGRLRDDFWVFYPYGPDGLTLRTEQELMSAVPRFAEKYLVPNQSRLSARTSLSELGTAEWWALSRPRVSWSFDPAPRVISKYFGGPGGFALDPRNEFVVVQGFAWFLKLRGEYEEEADQTAVDLQDLLAAYAAILNSQPFNRILDLFSFRVAGGQYDLSPRFVNDVPIPDLEETAKDQAGAGLVLKLSALGRQMRVADAHWRLDASKAVTLVYGLNPSDWV